MIDFPTNKANTTPVATVTGETTASKSGPALEQHSILKLLKQIPDQQHLIAKVKSSDALSTADKGLLQKVNAPLAEQITQQITKQLAQSSNQQENTAGNTNGLKQTLLAAKALYLVKLQIDIPNFKASTVTTITANKLAANQTVVVNKTGQQLQIVKPEKIIQPLMTKVLKEQLPKQQPISQLQNFTEKLLSLPTNIQSQLMNKALIESLKPLKSFIIDQQQTNNIPKLQQTLNNAGVQLESKLADVYAKQPAKAPNDIPTTPATQNTLTTKTTPAIEKNPHTLLQQAAVKNDLRMSLDQINRKIVSHDQSHTTTKPSVDKTATLDQELKQWLSQNHQPTPINTTAAVKNNPSLTNTTQLLFRFLGINIPNDVATKNISEAVQQQLKKMVEQSQARIQVNQLKSLLTDGPIVENRFNSGHALHTEMTLRFNEQLYPVQISIREDQIAQKDSEQEKSDGDSDDKKMEQRWEVMMSFDLPNDEKLHTQLSLINNNVSATLWAESAKLCHAANEAIHQLRDRLTAKGLTVDELTCLEGQPSSQNLSLDYHLVDVRT